MKKIFLFTFLFSGMYQFLTAQNDNIENLLFELPNVIFKKIETAQNFKATYELKIKQPLDHSDSSKGYFYQRAFLSHRDLNQPTIMITEGYDRPENKINELTDLLHGNQILIEHRYFGKSVPDTLDYNYLTLKQLTADLHHINTIFKNIYTGKWLSTGRSKGGATTLFYRYFYPEDVDVSVNYVGPINNAFEDQRIYKFLDTVGTASCRNKIKKFQTYLLENRKEIVPLLKAYSLGAKTEYTYLNFEEAFELSVMEYPFSFWQYGNDCNNIPDKTVSFLEAIKYLTSVTNITFFGDKLVEGYWPHYYQSATEFGYYGFETSEFKDLITALPTDYNPHATLINNHIQTPFDDSLLNNINAWLPEHGHKIVHIYGTLDTWTATGVPPSDKVDALWFFMNDKHHSNALIETMNAVEKEKLISHLERWLSLKIDAE
jgi:hypothetical protein